MTISRLVRWLALALLLYQCAPFVQAASTAGPMALTDGAHYLFDAKHRSVEALLSEPLTSYSWKSNDRHPANLGFSNDVLWLRASAQFPDNDASHVLAITQPTLNSARAYWLPKGATQAIELGRAGDHDLPEATIADHRYPVFDLPASGEGTLLVRLQSTSALIFGLEAWEAEAFARWSLLSTALWGAVFGVLWVMALYNLGLWFFIRDSAYLFYVGYTLCVSVYLAALSGLGFQFLWGRHSVWLNDNLYWIGAFSCFVFGALFVDRFLNLKQNNPVAHRLAYYIIAGHFGLIIAYSLLPEKDVAMHGHLYGIMVSVMVWILGIVETRKGTAGAAYFTVAWTLLVVGTCLYILLLMGLVPNNPFTQSVQTLGITTETVLLSFALGDRIRTLRNRDARSTEQVLALQQEISQAHEQNLRYQRQINERLETEVRNRTAALTRAKRKAEYASAQKTRFLAAAAHDIRQPLQAVRLLALKLPGEPAGRYDPRTAYQLRSATDNLVQLFDVLFDLSRLDSDAVDPQWELVEAAQFLPEFTDYVAPLCREAGISVHPAIDADTPAFRSDPLLLRRALLILVDNAIRHADCRRINIHATARDGLCVLSVIDDGRGIPESNQTAVFEEFTQIHRDPAHGKGLGMGLALARRIARTLQGELELHSVEGQGSRFELRLSASAAGVEDHATVPAPKSQQLESLAQCTVLVVDDDPDQRKELVTHLGRWGATCKEATNLRDALNLMEGGWRPDLAIVDDRLKTNGGDTALHAPILHLSADPDAATGNSHRPVLHKPVSPATLRTAVNHCLSARAETISS